MSPIRHGNALGHLWMLGLVGLSWAPARAGAERGRATAGTEPAEDGGSGAPDFDLGARLNAAYTSNLFHVTNEHRDEFETRNGAGDRFAGMKGPEDYVLSPELEAALGWDLGDDNELEVSLGGGYVAHVRNAIANYVWVEAGAEYELGKDDTLELEAELIPSRFKKNYPVDEIDVPGTNVTIYERADYLDLSLALSYEHEFGKRVSAEVEYGFETLGFDAPFTNRNVDAHALALLGAVKVGRFEIGGGVRGALGSTPHGLEFGITVDRSRYDIEPIATLEINLPSRFEIELGASYRIRTYTTDVVEDDTYFDRVDRKLTLGLEASKQLGKIWTVELEGGWVNNDANRMDAENDPDAVDYDELVVSAGVAAVLY